MCSPLLTWAVTNEAENCLLFLIITLRLLGTQDLCMLLKDPSIRHMFAFLRHGPTGVHHTREWSKVSPQWGNNLSVLTRRRGMHRRAELEGMFPLLLTLSRWGIVSIIHSLWVCCVVGRADRAPSSLPRSGSATIWCFICFSQMSLSMLLETKKTHHTPPPRPSLQMRLTLSFSNYCDSQPTEERFTRHWKH